MLFTLYHGKQACHRFVEGGRDPDNQLVIDRINEATRRLLPRLNDTFVHRFMRICTQNNSLTMPREVQQIEAVAIDNQPKRIFGQMYEFLENGPGWLCTGRYAAEKNLEDQGSGYPTFFDLPVAETALRLIAFSTELSDASCSLTLRGRLHNGEEVTTGGTPGETLAINRWQAGVEGQFAAFDSFEYSTSVFREVSSIVKPVTSGYISLYGYRPSDHQMWFLGKYHPDETHPGYRRYKLIGASVPDTHGSDDDYDTYGQTVVCLVKLGYVPLKHDTDVLLIQDLEALKLAVMSIRDENANNEDLSAARLGKAISLLNASQRDQRNPDMPINVRCPDEHSFGDEANII